MLILFESTFATVFDAARIFRRRLLAFIFLAFRRQMPVLPRAPDDFSRFSYAPRSPPCFQITTPASYFLRCLLRFIFAFRDIRRR